MIGGEADPFVRLVLTVTAGADHHDWVVTLGPNELGAVTSPGSADRGQGVTKDLQANLLKQLNQRGVGVAGHRFLGVNVIDAELVARLGV